MSEAEEWVDPWGDLSNTETLDCEGPSAWVSVKTYSGGALTSAPPPPENVLVSPTIFPSPPSVPPLAARRADRVITVPEVEVLELDEVFVEEDITEASACLDAVDPPTLTSDSFYDSRLSSEPVPLVEVVEAGVAEAMAWDDKPTLVEDGMEDVSQVTPLLISVVE